MTVIEQVKINLKDFDINLDLVEIKAKSVNRFKGLVKMKALHATCVTLLRLKAHKNGKIV